MMFPKKGRTTKRTARLHVLDGEFSIFIRQRDADEAGYCKCITCGKYDYWKFSTAGHFVLRDKMALRFDPRNVSAQCVYCNSFRSGMQYEHGVAIDKKWGEGTAAQLTAIGKIRGCKLDLEWIEYHIKKYRALNKKRLDN